MNFDSGNMYFSSGLDAGQGQHPPPRYFSQHPKNYNGKHYPFSVHGGSNNFSNHNALLNRGPPTTTSTHYDNPNYMPLSTPRRNIGWKYNPDSIPQTSSDPQPTTGHYCHLSYYGEEVDKDYLPDHHHHHSSSTKSNESTTFEQLSESPNLMASLHKSNNGITSFVPFKRNIEQRFNDGGHKYKFNHQQETEKFRESNKRWESHVKDEELKPEETLDDSVLVRNFQAAASCFQKQASQNEDLSMASPDSSQLPDGWSGVTTLRTQRRVVIKDDGYHTTKLPKLHKSFHTHLDLKSRRISTNKSLDKLITTSQRIKRRFSYADHHQVSERLHKSFNPNKSTWLSGDGKSFRIRRETSKMHAQKKRHQYPSTEEYYGLEGEFAGKNEESQYFSPSMKYRHHKRQKTEWDGSWRNSNGDDVVKTEKRPVVIDGSNVAFVYGEDLHFECKGIDACVAHFVEKGCDDISVIVPKDRLKPGASKDVEILQELKHNNMLIVNWNGQFASGSDDRYFILDVALDKGAIIVSNLNFTDVARVYPKMRHNIWNRVVNFGFTSDSPKEIVFPNIDPTGMCGPTWDDVLHN